MRLFSLQIFGLYRCYELGLAILLLVRWVASWRSVLQAFHWLFLEMSGRIGRPNMRRWMRGTWYFEEREIRLPKLMKRVCTPKWTIVIDKEMTWWRHCPFWLNFAQMRGNCILELIDWIEWNLWMLFTSTFHQWIMRLFAMAFVWCLFPWLYILTRKRWSFCFWSMLHNIV